MRILMVGLGGIGQRHARNLRTLLGNDCELLAYRVRRLSHVVTPQLEMDSSSCVDQEFGIRSFTDLGAALDARPDVAFICNPTACHVPVAMECVKSGCDLFIEKPVSDRLQGVDDLIEAAEARGRIAMVGYQLRFHPCIQRLQTIVANGEVGSVLAVRAQIGEYLPLWHKYEDYRQMYASRADLGGGVILSQIHEFDYLYAVFGFPKRIFAVGGHWSHLEIDVEDVASILMECGQDGRPLPIHLHLDYLQAPPSRQCEVIGDRGRVLVDINARSVAVYGRNGGLNEMLSFNDFERNQLFIDEIRHFLDCVVSRKKPLVDLSEGRQSLRIALAAKQSIASDAPVDLSEERELARV